MKKIEKFICCVFTILLTINAVNAQKNITQKTIQNQTQYVYYVDLKGIDTKKICLSVEENVSKKDGVVSFRTVGFPSKYFILSASKPVNESDLRVWLAENKIELIYFGVGADSKEALYMNKKKFK